MIAAARVALIAWFFGAYEPSLRLLPWRRWCVSLAFRFRWSGMERLSALFWRLARLWSLERTQPAISAYSTRLLMWAIMEGRE